MQDRRDDTPYSSFFEGCCAGKLNFFQVKTTLGEDPCSCACVQGYSLSGEVRDPQLRHSDITAVNYCLIKCLCVCEGDGDYWD